MDLKENELNEDIPDFNRKKDYKIHYVKTFVIHIILENVFIFLNILLGVILLKEYIPTDSKFWYSILILILPWIPGLIIIPSEISKHCEYLQSKNIVYKLTVYLIIMILFPLITSFIHILLLWGKLKDAEYKLDLQKITTTKLIMHTNIFLVVILFITIRGLLHFDMT